MKNIKIIFAMLLTNVTLVCAQELKPNSTVKTKHSSFRTKVNEHGTMNIENDKNILSKQRPKNLRFEIDQSTDPGLLAAFKQVFSDARLKELLPENAIGLTYCVAPDGKILEISYLLKPNTLVTAAELEALEIAIKNNVTIKLNRTKDNKQEADFVRIIQAVHYNQILNGTLKI
jgi:hypothetical protein